MPCKAKVCKSVAFTRKDAKPFGKFKNLLEALMADAPYVKCSATQHIINISKADNTGECLGALAVQAQPSLAASGVWSIDVKETHVRFNLPFEIGGKLVHLRCFYTAPAPLARAAGLLDLKDRAKGIEAARKATKPFTFILQRGHMKLVKFATPAQLKVRRKRVKHRKACEHPVYRPCKRRFHPTEAYPEVGAKRRKAA